MGKSIAVFDKNNKLYISAFGLETESEKAHWGRGRRADYILHYVLTGEGYFNSEKVKAGQGFFIRPSDFHEYHSSKEKPWTYFWVIFNGSKVEELCCKYINLSEKNIFDYSFKPELLKLSDLIFSDGGAISGIKALGYFFLLMSYHEKRAEYSGNKYVEEAKKYMKIHFPYKVTVTEVAEALNISDRYLYNLFVKHEGIPPKKYLGMLKLKRACDMLKNSYCSVAEAAASAGFDDALAFSRFFSKNMGISPTKYRNT